MKRYKVKRLSVTPDTAQAVPDLLNQEKIAFEQISIANWKTDYPYTPNVQFRMAYAGNVLLLHYKVEEDSIRAVAAEDNGKVWEDSCCEFFISPVVDDTYYNIECNCAGTLLVGFGKDRNGRLHPSSDIMKEVSRWSSLGREPFAEKVGSYTWELALIIPTTVFFKHKEVVLTGRTIRANFYKCGDKLEKCHFLSWNEIDVPNPDFHRPEFFGELIFE